MPADFRTLMMARIDTGEPFLSRDLANIAIAAGHHRRVHDSVQALIQALKAQGYVKQVGNSGAAYIWQRSAAVPPPPVTDAPIPQPMAVAVQGPFDPDPTVEGVNQGFTERLAEFLWEIMGRGQANLYADEPLRESTTPMEANGWRHLSLRILQFMEQRGFHGPGGPRKDAAPWDYAWVYEISDWAIYDGENRFVATCGQDDDVSLILAAPKMAAAIRTVLDNGQANGGFKKSDVALLAAAVDGLPETRPAAPKSEETASESIPN
jgi:hypothetical protein